MKTVLKVVVAMFVVCAFGCGTMGQLEVSSGPVSITTGEKIRSDYRKREALLEDHGVERLLDYVLHYARQNRIRTSLKMDITITTLRIGWGRDHMSIRTVFSEHGQKIGQFTCVSTTNGGNRIKRFTKDLAKQLIVEARHY